MDLNDNLTGKILFCFDEFFPRADYNLLKFYHFNLTDFFSEFRALFSKDGRKTSIKMQLDIPRLYQLAKVLKNLM